LWILELQRLLQFGAFKAWVAHERELPDNTFVDLSSITKPWLVEPAVLRARWAIEVEAQHLSGDALWLDNP
jgi:hypothetical protein